MCLTHMEGAMEGVSPMAWPQSLTSTLGHVSRRLTLLGFLLEVLLGFLLCPTELQPDDTQPDILNPNFLLTCLSRASRG